MYKVYSNINCPACQALKQRLTEWGIPFENIMVNKDPQARELLAAHGLRSVPQLFKTTGELVTNPMDKTREELLG